MKKQFKNKSEEFVYHISKETFLSLWSYANPQGKDPGQELCDTLIVCDPDIIVISVKENSLPKGDIDHTALERWKREAISKSCKQIYGAVRYLKSAEYVTRYDGSRGLPLPDVNSRRIHRIAIALGGSGKTFLSSGDFGKGFVHIFDQTSFNVVLRENDTIVDFVEYLQAKESFCKSQGMVLVNGGEEDLLAFYLFNGRTFPAGRHQLVTVEGGMWEKFAEGNQYKAKKQEDKISYLWDRLIEYFTTNLIQGDVEFGSTLSDIELSLRTMAREGRFSRRLSGESYDNFMTNKAHVHSRIHCSELSGVTYVFLAIPYEEGREYRITELKGRCYIARGMVPENKTVIGLATESSAPMKGFSFDVLYLHQEEWTEEDRLRADKIKKVTHFFEKPRVTNIRDDEYPLPNKSC